MLGSVCLLIDTESGFSHVCMVTFTVREFGDGVFEYVRKNLTDIYNREEFRKISVISPVCINQVSGLGKDSYIKGLKLLINYLVAH